MNFNKYEVEEIKITTQEQGFDVLKALISTIIFNWALGLKEAHEERCKNIDIYYTKIDNKEIEKQINEGITRYLT